MVDDDISDCGDLTCRICYNLPDDESWVNYKDDERPLTNKSFDDEGL